MTAKTKVMGPDPVTMKMPHSIKIWLDPDCTFCQKVYQYFRELEQQHPNHYCDQDMKSGKHLLGIILRPDYNSCGHLTHWHLTKEEHNPNNPEWMRGLEG